MADLPVLTIQQLHTVARLVYLQEEQAINGIKFESEPSLVKYLQNCKACYDSVVAFLNEASSLEHEYPDNSTKAPIASDIFSYMVSGANFAVQVVKNYTLRMDYIKKIGDCSREIRNELAKEADNNVIEIKRLAKDAHDFRIMGLEFITKGQVSPVSHEFLKWLKESGLKFMDLIQMYQNKGNYIGLFKDLKDVVKIQVYGDILEAAGRPRFRFNMKSIGRASTIFILFTVGFMVWDLFTDDCDVIQTATRDIVVTLASVGGALVSEFVGVTLAYAAGLSAGMPLMAGLIVGFAGAFIIGEFTGWLIDSMFAGTYDTLSTEGHRFYVAELPDGEALARQLVHQNN